MKSSFRRIAAVALVAITGAAAFLSCGEEKSSDGPVSVTIAEESAGPQAGNQFISVKADSEWILSFKEECAWAGISKTSGRGDAHPVLSWTANEQGSARSCTIEARSASGKYRSSVTFSQLAGDAPVVQTTDEVQAWLELPAVDTSDSGTGFYSHNMTVGKYEGRNYSFLYDYDARVARWVAYPLNKSLTGSGSRTDQWSLDPKLSAQQQAVLYKGFSSGYQRGHQLPSADRLSYSTNVTTFYFTNMTPQKGELNEKAWATLEGYVRNWSNQFDTLYVVTGADVRGSVDVAYDNEGREVTVPSGYFKALLGYKKGGTLGITGSTGGYTAIGFYFEHRYYSDGAIMSTQAMTVDELEKMTGYDFFVNLPGTIGSDMAAKVESTRDNWWWNSNR